MIISASWRLRPGEKAIVLDLETVSERFLAQNSFQLHRRGNREKLLVRGFHWDWDDDYIHSPQCKRERYIIDAVWVTQSDAARRRKLKLLELRRQAEDFRLKSFIRNGEISFNNRWLFGPTGG